MIGSMALSPLEQSPLVLGKSLGFALMLDAHCGFVSMLDGQGRTIGIHAAIALKSYILNDGDYFHYFIVFQCWIDWQAQYL